ncbi:uncharacterized protein BP5553_00287 [Venustampulla echinocandica]|uniref:Uncharacterized protein n=1 Tax=Venustampulla echinocandica TaxID=2656787 RepID=A0A370TXS9_9HELO|nr:uncharacterized protein BP5553_00287 [Venustampulla echinocandica]RDL40308.1 hypothetical protein BP5553_00287 [Venustampulla echinocandica]
MSRRGVVPLLLATAFGIVNGFWVFSPSLNEHRQAALEQARKPLETPDQIDQGIDSLKTPDNVKPMANDSAVNGPTLESNRISKSWWPRMSFWAQAEGVSKTAPSTTPRSNDTQSKSEENRS